MPDDSDRSLEQLVGAWLSSDDSPESADTMIQQRTIEPRHDLRDTGGARAIAALQKVLSGSTRVSPVETLGQGGMGVVRLAEQVALGRMVAVKTLRPDRPGDGPALDLLREAWVTGMLEHPNVVPVYDIGLDDKNRPMIVLKRIEGHSWFELIDDPARVKELFGVEDQLAWNLDILMQVLQALRFAHSRGIVHRDLKPDNVMIGDFGEVYLLDWGIAVSLKDDGSGRLPLARDATELAGTPCYMAPEMLGGKGGLPLSEKTDIYLAGAVLYEILTGQPPHQGETAQAVVASVVKSDPPFPPEVPAELVKICRRAMDADPDGRFENAEQVRLALRGYLQRRGSMRLAEAADRRLESLLEAIADCGEVTDPAKRQELYDLFGAARFGFHEALASWRDNQAAHDGLRRAIGAMIGFELEHGDPRAAAGLLAQMSSPPPGLKERVDAEVAAAKKRHDELERLEQSLDSRIGTRTRTFGTLLMGAMFTLAPIVSEHSSAASMDSHRTMVVWSIGFWIATLLFGAWARQSMMRTAFNRRVWMTTQLVFLGQLVLHLGAWWLGIDPVTTNIFMMFQWFIMAAVVAIVLEWRLWPTAVGFGVAFLVAGRWPDARFAAMAVSNAILTINAVWVWRPASFRMTDAERAEFRPRSRRRA